MNEIRDIPYNNVIAPFFAKLGKNIIGLRLSGRPSQVPTLLIVTRQGYIRRTSPLPEFSLVLRLCKEQGIYPLPPNLSPENLFDYLFLQLNRSGLTYDLP